MQYNPTLEPNPAERYVQATGIEQEVVVQLINAEGAIVLHMEVGPEAPIDISHLPSGLYRYLIYDVKGAVAGKIKKL